MTAELQLPAEPGVGHVLDGIARTVNQWLVDHGYPVADDPRPALLDVFVSGKPAPQGSKRYLGAGRPLVESSKAVEPWRADIRGTIARQFDQPPVAGAVAVDLEFVLHRPVGTPKRATPAAVKRPDLDKLDRAVLDAITSAGVLVDDSQVIDLHSTKRLAEIGETTGCRIVVREVP